jgi:ELP3 family radical SAM enzyme/protein acetyltransferase
MTSSPVISIEELVKPYGINITNIDEIYAFLDMYYDQKVDKSNIKKDFIKYQIDNKFTQVTKVGILIYIYQLGRLNGRYKKEDLELEKYIKVRDVRENSGVMVFSIFTSAYPYGPNDVGGVGGSSGGVGSSVGGGGVGGGGSSGGVGGSGGSGKEGAFSCKYNCAFCPSEPGQPKSYMAGEPGVDRAIQNDYDPIKQVFSRAIQYVQQGHIVDKIEVIIQGGTWDSYEEDYRVEFVRDIYYAFNVFMNYLQILVGPSSTPSTPSFLTAPANPSFIFNGCALRSKLSLEEEIKINETGMCRVIGLTPETRPDQINYKTIQFLRRIGATRLQIGVQHLNDDILRYVERGCYRKHTENAIKMLKDNGFKVDAHLMLDLPAPPGYEGRMAEVDAEMLTEFNTNPAFKVDQIKIYPCMVTPYTKIKEWYEQGIYKPYGEDIPKTSEEKIEFKKLSKIDKVNKRLENPLYKNILTFYTQIHPSIRTNRIIRDLPSKVLLGGTMRLGMRSEIERDIDTLGLVATCIRSREIGNHKNVNLNLKEPELQILEFESSGGREYFLSYEHIYPDTNGNRSILFSFLRLRLSKNAGCTDKGKVIFPDLCNTALVRELHTYGPVTPCKENQGLYTSDGGGGGVGVGGAGPIGPKISNLLMASSAGLDISQHKGYGKKLLQKAEEIAFNNGYKKIAVIAGVGVRNYYRKQGYVHDTSNGCFQLKHLEPCRHVDITIWLLHFLLFVFYLLFV